MMAAPRRIRLSRAAGWRMPENTVKVTRPGAFGNPFSIAECRDLLDLTDNSARLKVVSWFREWVGFPIGHESLDQLGAFGDTKADHRRLLGLLPTLRGKNLACWCRLCERHRDGKPFDEPCAACAPCHADVLGQIANGFKCEAVP